MLDLNVRCEVQSKNKTPTIIILNYTVIFQKKYKDKASTSDPEQTDTFLVHSKNSSLYSNTSLHTAKLVNTHIHMGKFTPLKDHSMFTACST